jgi:hypothetical protein
VTIQSLRCLASFCSPAALLPRKCEMSNLAPSTTRSPVTLRTETGPVHARVIYGVYGPLNVLENNAVSIPWHCPLGKTLLGYIHLAQSLACLLSSLAYRPGQVIRHSHGYTVRRCGVEIGPRNPIPRSAA